jgi:hypothetical protein
MQQTQFDRWLRKKFIYINRIYCNTLPHGLPTGLRIEEAPEESGGRYLYKLSTRSDRVLAEVTYLLEAENITYTARVEDRRTFWNRLFNHPQKSFSFRVAWALIAVAGLIFSLSGMPQEIWAKLTEEEVEEELVSQPKKEEDIRVYQFEDKMYEIDRQKEN